MLKILGIISKMDLTDIYRTFHPDTKDNIPLFHNSGHAFLSSPYILTMTKSEQIQINLKQKKKNPPCILFGHHGVKAVISKTTKILQTHGH